jgi:pimeloyl-ACP methyl ester carboxylesterase
MEFKYKNKTINYEEDGSGPTMLFVHGWGGNMDSLKGLYENFSQKYRCVRLDLPGFGGSSNPDPDWGIKEYAECIKSFIGDEKVIYCGHSFGGAIGIYLAAEYENLSKLILFAPSFHRKNNGPKVKKVTFPGYYQVKMALTPFRKIAYRILYPGSQALKYPL